METENQFQKKFKTLFDGVNDAVLILRNGEMAEFNLSFLNMFKCTEEQIRGKEFYKLISLQQADNNLTEIEVKDFFENSISGLTSHNQIVFRRFDGFPFFGDVKISRVETIDDKIIFIIIQDITEYRLSKQALKESEQNYKELIDAINSAIFKMDLDGTILFANKYSEELFGFSLKEIVGKNIVGTILENEQVIYNSINGAKEVSIKVVLECLDEFSSIDSWNNTKGGEKIFVTWTYKPVYSISNDLIGVICFGINRTESKLFYDKLVESEKKFKLIFNAVTDGISIISTSGELLEVNDHLLKIFGYSREDFEKLPPSQRWPTYLKESLPRMLEISRDKSEVELEVDNIDALGRKYPVEIRAKEVFFEGKKAYIAVSRDISERKEHQKAIYNAVVEAEERERSRVAKELHDGVSPILSTAKLYAQSLRSTKDEDLKDSILLKVEETIDESIQEVSEISNNLSPHILQNFGLKTALHSFIDKSSEIRNVQINFYCKFEERLSNTLEVTMYRVTIELLSNTFKYACASAIHIEIKKGEKLSLRYSDNGVGYNLLEIRKENLGMGLYNIKNRIESLNGKVELISFPGDGFKAYIEIPINEKKN